MSSLQSRNSKTSTQQALSSTGCAGNQQWDEDTVVLPTEYEQQLQAISRRLEKCRS